MNGRMSPRCFTPPSYIDVCSMPCVCCLCVMGLHVAYMHARGCVYWRTSPDMDCAITISMPCDSMRGWGRVCVYMLRTAHKASSPSISCMHTHPASSHQMGGRRRERVRRGGRGGGRRRKEEEKPSHYGLDRGQVCVERWVDV